MIKQALIIFQKNLIPGKVKTRLANDIGDVEALKVYQFLVDSTVKVVCELEVDKFVFYSDFIDDSNPIESGKFHYAVQSGDHLGERMKNAFQLMFSKGYRSVVLIGTDCPELGFSGLINAFQLLDKNDVVLGPAKDGGYYLLGMSSFCPGLFEGIPWSTDQVLKLTRDRADQLNLTYEFLEVLSDIDTLEDWKIFRQKNQISHE
jgi:uncharacterized protein